MKKLILILFVFMSFLTFGQKTKTVKIWTKPMTREILNANYNYDVNNDLVAVNIHLMGRDSRYKQLIESFTIYYGSPSEFYTFLNEIEKFCSENEPDTSTEIFGQTVSLVKIMGMTGLFIYEKDGYAYRSFSRKAISKFKSVFEKWAKNNNIDYQNEANSI